MQFSKICHDQGNNLKPDYNNILFSIKQKTIIKNKWSYNNKRKTCSNYNKPFCILYILKGISVTIYYTLF